MIIECPACRARFKLDEAKIKGRGARVRCRRCGEAIVVLKPEETQAEAARGAGGGFLDLRSVVRESVEEKAEEASREPSPERKEKEPDALPDLAVDFRPEEKIDLDHPAEPPREPAAPDFLIGSTETLDFLKEEHGGGKEGERLDISTSLRQEPGDLLVPTGIPAPPLSAPAAPESMTDVTAPAESAPDAPVPPEQQAPGEPFRPKPAGPRKSAPPMLRPSLIALVLLFVALAGGGAYLGFTKSGQDLLRGLVPGMESLWLRGDGRPGPQYDVRNLIGYFEQNTRAGNLFVIKGQVVNMGRTRKSGIRVRAALLDGKDHPLSERISYAGTVLSGETLRTASREKIEEALSNRFGDKLVNMDVAPGKSVPFMVVFFNAPEGIGAYRLEAKDSD